MKPTLNKLVCFLSTSHNSLPLECLLRTSTMVKPLNCSSARMSCVVPVTGELTFKFRPELRSIIWDASGWRSTLLTTLSQGGKAGAVQKCVACRGRGMRIMIRQLAPGMVQQMQSVCTDCNGEGSSPWAEMFFCFFLSGRWSRASENVLRVCAHKGEVINEKDRCRKCEGHKVCKETKLLEVHVDKGMKHGQKITFSGEADQAPGVEPGDIVLILQEKEHEVNGIHQTISCHSYAFFHFHWLNHQKKFPLRTRISGVKVVTSTWCSVSA